MEWKRLLSTARWKYLSQKIEPSLTIGGDLRDEFDRDYGRAVFCTPTRRLQDKTQVFPMDPNDSIRTRLTHSIEVSSVARGAAMTAAIWMEKEGHATRDEAKAIETIAATCGLIHDLGNPPFGHSGEKAIAEWFSRKGEGFFWGMGKQHISDFLHFEGNAQTLRLITRLQILADYFGLNPTCGTLSAALKYTAASNSISEDRHEWKKPGYFASENDLIAKLREATGTGDARNPITYLVEAADDCVYNTVDLEDGATKGLVDWGLVKERLTQQCQDERILKETIGEAEKRIENAESLGLSPKEREGACFQYFRAFAIRVAVVAVVEEFKRQYQAIMEGAYHSELIKTSAAASLMDTCKKICREHVYCGNSTLELELLGRRVINDLMDIYWEGVEKEDPGPREFPGKTLRLMSQNYRRVYRHARETNHLPEQYCRMQLLTDYVCGMTDSFACRVHQKLTRG